MVVRSRRCEMIKDSAARTCRSRSSRALCLNAILVELPRILIGYGSRPAVISQSGQTVLSDRRCSICQIRPADETIPREEVTACNLR